ncbi:MAG: MFS transporter [Actinobacteria bacterium]|nr:MFS transporter [Actinomycetota bacterium]
MKKKNSSIEEIESDVLSTTTEVAGRTIFRGGALSALGIRDFRLIWSGAFLSNIGTWMHTTALLWFVKNLTKSNTLVGTVNLANYLPVFVLVLLGGSLADRLNRKRVILVSQAAMMLGALALGICTSLGVASFPLIIVLTVEMGVALAFNFPTWQSISPDLVPNRDMRNAIAVNSAQFNLARFLGPILGGLIVRVWNVAAAFYVNAASFLTVIAAVLLMKTETPPSEKPHEGVVKHIMEGIRFVRRRRWAVTVLVTIGITSFFALPYMVLMPAVAKDVLHRGLGGYLLMFGLSGLGAVIAAPLVTVLNRRLREREIIKMSMFGLGLFLLAFALSRTYWLSLVLSVGLGANYLMVGASINTVLQSKVDRDMRGRIMSLYILLFLGGFALGGQLMGYLADIRSTSFSLFLGGAVCLALAAVLILFPGLTKDAVSPPRPARPGIT